MGHTPETDLLLSVFFGHHAVSKSFVSIFFGHDAVSKNFITFFFRHSGVPVFFAASFRSVIFIVSPLLVGHIFTTLFYVKYLLFTNQTVTMFRWLVLMILTFPLVSFHLHGTAEKKCCVIKKAAGRCTGSAYCTACSNCSACKWCSAGGTCGVCDTRFKKKKKTLYQQPVPSTSGHGKCNAVTKKGAQCSRNAKSNGYCWQHGG